METFVERTYSTTVIVEMKCNEGFQGDNVIKITCTETSPRPYISGPTDKFVFVCFTTIFLNYDLYLF